MSQKTVTEKLFLPSRKVQRLPCLISPSVSPQKRPLPADKRNNISLTPGAGKVNFSELLS